MIVLISDEQWLTLTSYHKTTSYATLAVLWSKKTFSAWTLDPKLVASPCSGDIWDHNRSICKGWDPASTLEPSKCSIELLVPREILRALNKRSFLWWLYPNISIGFWLCYVVALRRGNFLKEAIFIGVLCVLIQEDGWFYLTEESEVTLYRVPFIEFRSAVHYIIKKLLS